MEEPFESEGIRGILEVPEQTSGHALALTHGAGSDCRAPVLVRIARLFADAGYTVLRFNLPFRQARPKGPPRPGAAAKDREGIAAAVEALRSKTGGRIFLGGHSYGGRQSAMLLAEDPSLADALLLLSYPLHPPGRADQKRTAFFPELRTPTLFVHGSVDPFASLEELRDAMALIPARTDLLPVEGAGHDLKRATGLSSELLARWHALIGLVPEN
jgi:predicted alpha/beta-hydrolase family hydrolase